MKNKIKSFLFGYNVLKEAPNQDLSNDFVLNGIIHKFEFVYERSVKLMKGLCEHEGVKCTESPRDVLRTSYTLFDFMEEEVWLDMIVDYIQIENLYDYGKKQKKLVDNILNVYIPAFATLDNALRTLVPEDYTTAVREMDEIK